MKLPRVVCYPICTARHDSPFLSRSLAEREELFPGYILVKMEMNDDTWHIVKDTPRVSGFLGSHNKPQPISQREVERIINQIEQGIERPTTEIYFEVGEQVRVTDGPFASFVGVVEEVNTEKSRLKSP